MRPLLRFAVLVSALIAGPVFALPTATEIKASFRQIDANDDGECSLAEWEKASLVQFRSLDENRNRTLEPAEVRSNLLADGIFAEIDLDHDGHLSSGEFMALRNAIFHAADIDSTDSLNFVEYELFRLLAEAGWVDANKNHRIEIPELRASLQQVFAKADRNHDGRLTAAEATFLQPEDFSALTKHSGFLDAETLLTGYKQRLTQP